MKLVAVAINYDERFCFSREIEPNPELTDEEILQFMADCLDEETPLDSCILITFEEDGSVFTQELIES